MSWEIPKKSALMSYAIRNMSGRFKKLIFNHEINDSLLYSIVPLIERAKIDYNSNISKLIKEKNKNPAYRKNISDKLKEYLRNNKEVIEKRRKIMKERWKNQKYRKYMSKVASESNNNEDNLKNNIERGLKRYKNMSEHIKTSECVKNYYLQHPEARKKISENSSRMVLQYSMDGIFIKEWKSRKEASLFYKHSATGISDCISGRRKSSMGFIWRNKTENFPLKIDVNIERGKL